VVTSQNGYGANDRSVIVSYAVPGGKLALRRGAAGELLAAAVRRWHDEVEPLKWPGVWGYAERPIRGSTTVLSNHASGTGADCNAPAHPLGTSPEQNMTPAKIAAVRRIVADSDGCLRWGGDYTGRKDPMHLEVIGGEAACAKVLARWRGQPAAPGLPPAAGSVLATLRFGMRGDERVKRLQQFLNRYDWRPPLPLLPATGNYLEQTRDVVKAAQAQCGVTGPDADGTIVGPRTSSAFAARGASW
jgi:D-alanyl-D-alanine carboxypeptidase/Putative peptidoglycan binding domain